MKELSKAMAEAFPEIEGAIKDKINPHFRSKYADLGNVIAAIKPALASRGLWFTQILHDTAGFATVETVIWHSSGESLSCGKISVPVAKNDAQGFGSALTYARRYSLSSAFGVAPEDDDGNAACKKEPKVEEEEEIIKLDRDQVENLASQIAPSLTKFCDEDLEAQVGPLTDWLLECQSKMKSSLDKGLPKWMKEPKKVAEAFIAWKAKKVAENAA